MPTSLTQIFLSYPIEDEKQAYDLYQRLGEAGFKPWMFSQDLQPGASTITGPEQALRQSDLFLALLSTQSTGRKGIYEKEWQIALEVWKERGAGIFIIPVRLEECKVPNALKEFQAVDLFVEGGWEKLLATLHSVAGVPLEPPTPTILPSFTPISRAQPVEHSTQADWTQWSGFSSRRSSWRSGQFSK